MNEAVRKNVKDVKAKRKQQADDDQQHEIKSDSYEQPRKEIWKKYELPHVEAGVTIVDSELPHVEVGVHFLGSGENKEIFENHFNNWKSKDGNVENLSSTERRKKTDQRRTVSGLKQTKLYLEADILTQIHERMVSEGYNKGVKYKNSKSVNCEDVSEFITYMFNKYKEEKPNPKTHIETHLYKLKSTAEHLSSELTTYGVAEFMNILGYEKPIYLTNNVVTIDVKDEFSEDMLDLNPKNHNPIWTENDVALLLDDKTIQNILRLMP